MSTPTNEQLRARGEQDFADGEPAWEAVRGWLDRHAGRPWAARCDDRVEWLDWAATNFVNDPLVAPYLIDRGKLHEYRQSVREEERRMAYTYLKEQAEEIRGMRGTGSASMPVLTAQNNMVRIAGEILRGLHANPVKVNNPELWK